MKLTHTKLALAVLFAALVMTSLGASAQIWSAAAATCAVDEDSLTHYVFKDAGQFTVPSGYYGESTVRCGVVNPLDSGNPGWGRLYLGFYDPGSGASATATLYEVSRTPSLTGFRRRTIAAVTSLDIGYGFNYTPFSYGFNFSQYVYFVQVVLDNPNNSPPAAFYVTLEP